MRVQHKYTEHRGDRGSGRHEHKGYDPRGYKSFYAGENKERSSKSG